MITHLRFKNWRSLRDATIDNLTPITVFIGANSSGKTNILDGLYFLRDAVSSGLPVAWNRRSPPDDYRTLGSKPDLPLEIEISFQPNKKGNSLSYKYGENGLSGSSQFFEKLTDDRGEMWLKSDDREILAKDEKGDQIVVLPTDSLGITAFGRLSTYPQIQQTFQFLTQRWQMLDENFMPPMQLDTRSSYSPYVIDRCADNLPIMLEYMKSKNKKAFDQLEEDLGGLLGHVDKLEVNQLNFQLRTSLLETSQSNTSNSKREAPTVSAGTARIIAMLTAYYALEISSKEMSGLVVIEEPDTALNPGLLSNFVGLLRNYVASEYPRQFILTTHNPAFLNFFEPEEVRIVKRDEQGYTSVEAVPEHIREVWLDEYGLGEVWTTNSLGGLAE